jgi:hypothetical protein
MKNKEEKQPLLQIKEQGREQAPVTGKSGGFLSIHELQDRKLQLSDMDYCVRFAEPKEWTRWRKEAEERRSKIPAYSYWKCPACGWSCKLRGDSEGGGPCMRCNRLNLVGGARLVKMTEKETRQFDEDEAREFKRDVERLNLMEFNRRNEERGKVGLPALARAEFDAARKKEYQREREDMARLLKVRP